MVTEQQQMTPEKPESTAEAKARAREETLRILRNTHAPDNVKRLLKREYLFDRARFFHGCKIGCLLAPLVAFVILGVVVKMLWPSAADRYLDYVVGFVAVVSFLLSEFVFSKKIEKYMTLSNSVREEYECNVLGLDENPFWYGREELLMNVRGIEQYRSENKKEYDSVIRRETWYKETFSEDRYANAICVMMDNVVYWHYVYADYKNVLRRRVVMILVAVVLVYPLFFLILRLAGLTNLPSGPFVLFVSMFDGIKEAIAGLRGATDQAEIFGQLKEFVKKEIVIDAGDQSTTGVSEKNTDPKVILRALQDVILRNRDVAPMPPKSLREKYLDNSKNKCYLDDLDEIKNLYWNDRGMQVYKPEQARDFELHVYKDNAEGDEETDALSKEHDDAETARIVTLEDVQKQLMIMLGDVKELFGRENIPFMLDGGTLLGSLGCEDDEDEGKLSDCMKKERLLPWDDDMDLSMNIDDVPRAIKAINNYLSDRYVTQDCESETFFSPRLSYFRIRQKNELSMTTEKDSELSEKYENRGLFLDVYVFGPIIGSRSEDTQYREKWFHPLYRKLKRTEYDWKAWKELEDNNEGKKKHAAGKKREKAEKRFIKLKKQFMDRREKYLELAKNDNDYSYVPGYFDCTSNSVHYMTKEELYGDDKEEDKCTGKLIAVNGACTTKEEVSRTYRIPAQPDKGLQPYYSDWYDGGKRKNPFVPLDQLKKENGKTVKYSTDNFFPSTFKHLETVWIRDCDNDVND